MGTAIIWLPLNELTPEQKRVAKELLDSLILKHTANRLATG